MFLFYFEYSLPLHFRNLLILMPIQSLLSWKCVLGDGNR